MGFNPNYFTTDLSFEDQFYLITLSFLVVTAKKHEVGLTQPLLDGRGLNFFIPKIVFTFIVYDFSYWCFTTATGGNHLLNVTDSEFQFHCKI